MMLNLSDPRGNGRKEVKNTVENSTWESNVAFSEKMKSLLAKHPLSTHPLKEFFEKETLSDKASYLIHLEFGYGFAQIFTDAVLEAMSKARQLETRLGPKAKVTARFLWAINLMDEIGYAPGENGDQYRGHPFGAHYYQYVDMFDRLGGKMSDLIEFSPSPETLAARKTFEDNYGDYKKLSTVLALSESIFDNFAGAWADNVERSTGVDTSTGYHTIHVEDEHGESVDDDHSEDGWTLVRQALEESDYDDIEKSVIEWLDCWYKFADKMMEIAMT